MGGRRFEAVLFDLDGVLADSARQHYLAWKRLADELGIAFDDVFNERLKGVDRMGSLALILAHGGREAGSAEREELAARKNGYYRELILETTPDDLLPGAQAALEACRALGLKTALASASKNAPTLLERLGIAGLIDHVADPAEAASKPDPGIFLMASEGVGVAPARAIALDDAIAGVEAAKAAGCYTIGVGDPDILKAADAVIPDIAAFEVKRFLGRVNTGLA